MDSVELRFKTIIEIDYPHIIKRGAVEDLAICLRQLIKPERPLVFVTDESVPQQHIDAAIKSIRNSEWHDAIIIKLPSGECHKNYETHQKLINNLHKHRVHRRSVLLAFGGGVLIDTVGFVAASYMRGIDYINIPTTLIGQVDAGVGGKVAVNHPRCKNLIGAFWHPLGVIIDPDILHSLIDEEIRNGLAEVVKVAMIHSPSLFNWLEEHAKNSQSHRWRGTIIDRVIMEAVRSKIELLMPDPFESNLKRVLNFGHTFAHPLEVMSGYTLRHGYAVSIGMCISTLISKRRGLISAQETERLFSLLRSLGLPVSVPRYDTEVLWKHVNDIRAIRANHLYFVIPISVGEVIIIDDLLKEEFIDAYMSLLQDRSVT